MPPSSPPPPPPRDDTPTRLVLPARSPPGVPEGQPVPPMSSIERVKAKESFAPDEPLPAFTYPVLDDAKKLELLERVEEARAAAAASTPAARDVSPRGRVPLVEARAVLLGVGQRVATLVRRWIDAACTFLDGKRSLLPASVRAPLSKVPTGVILGALVVQALAIVVGGLVLLGNGGADVAAPSEEKEKVAPVAKVDPIPRELEQAKKQGHAALEALVARFPADHRVLLEVAASSSAKADHAAAVGALGKALAAAPETSEQAVASDVLAQAIRKRDTAPAAFELLRGPMGAAGAAVLYDLSIDVGAAAPLRASAEEWVRSDAFRKVAAPDVQLAGALRYARSCSARHVLLPRVAEEGGRRTLDWLKLAKTPGGCGRNARKDCFPCLRKDDLLRKAMAAIEARLAAR